MALKFYRRLTGQTKVLSFDLDDTLYQNDVVIHQAEQAQFEAVCQVAPQAREHGVEYWRQLKWQVAKQQPALCHDVTNWRLAVIKLGMAKFGITEQHTINDIYNAFYLARSNFTVPKVTFDVLNQLQQQFTLVAVTNGNADIQRLGLSGYFAGYYRAGEQNCRMKPHPDMLHKVAKDLNVPHYEIIHIGDNVGSDVQAAINANVNSFWFNPSLKPYLSGHVLPDAEYSCITDLLQLLE